MEINPTFTITIKCPTDGWLQLIYLQEHFIHKIKKKT